MLPGVTLSWLLDKIWYGAAWKHRLLLCRNAWSDILRYNTITKAYAETDIEAEAGADADAENDGWSDWYTDWCWQWWSNWLDGRFICRWPNKAKPIVRLFTGRFERGIARWKIIRRWRWSRSICRNGCSRSSGASDLCRSFGRFRRFGKKLGDWHR